MKYQRLLASLGVLVAALVLASAAAAQTAGVTVVASGLNNPRGLVLGPNGELFVAEAGNGGAGPCAVASNGNTVCFGLTGAITRISSGRGGFPFQDRVARGLPSLGLADGTGHAGPHDVTLGAGAIDIAMGLGGSPAFRSLFGPAAALLGHVVRLDLEGRPRSVGDFAAVEALLNPDGAEINSNPYSLVFVLGGYNVADAGANAILRIEPDGTPRVAAFFPPRLFPAPFPPNPLIPTESVTDSIVIGPDGANYYGELTGFPFPVGAARVHRRAPGPGQPVTVFATGFTNIIDIAFGPDGSLYVLEFARNGLLAGPFSRLIRVAPNGTRTTVLDQGLIAASGLAIASNGDIYISNFGTSPTNGQVLLLRAPNTGDVDSGDRD